MVYAYLQLRHVLDWRSNFFLNIYPVQIVNIDLLLLGFCHRRVDYGASRRRNREETETNPPRAKDGEKNDDYYLLAGTNLLCGNPICSSAAGDGNDTIVTYVEILIPS